jgi:hypothetical protein
MIIELVRSTVRCRASLPCCSQRDGFISNIGGTVGVICGIPNQANMLAPIAAIKWHG